MFEELRLLWGTRLIYVPAICMTLWSLHGIFVRGWSVGQLFFWVWVELILTGAACLLALYQWHRLAHGATRAQALRVVMIAFAGLFPAALLATVFSLGAWAADFGDFSHLPPFLRERRFIVLFYVVAYAVVYGLIVCQRGFRNLRENDVTRPLLGKFIPVLGLYFVLILQYHFTGSTKLDYTQGYLLFMGGTLLAFKLFWECRALWKRPA